MSEERLDQATELGQLVHSARGDLPDAALLSRVAARLPDGAFPTASPGAAASATGFSAGVKLLLGLVVAGGVGAASYAAFGGGSTGTTQRPGPIEVATASAPAGASGASPEPAASVAPAPMASAATNPSAAAGQGSQALPVARSAAPPVEQGKASAAASLSQEAKLLEQARRELVKQPAKALATTEQHKRRFPNGALSQEREVIAIQALKALKREREANSRAATFEAEHPGSAHQRKVESVVEP